MPSSNLTLRADKAEKYIKSLSKHFARKIEVTQETEVATVAFPMGLCRMFADGREMHFCCKADSDQALEAVKTIINSHVTRFGELKNVTVQWDNT